MKFVLLVALLLSGCAAYRDGRSLICFGWCWQIEGETVVTPPDLKTLATPPRSLEPLKD